MRIGIRWMRGFAWGAGVLAVAACLAFPSVGRGAGNEPLPSVSEDARDRAQAYYERGRVLEEWRMWEKAVHQYRMALKEADSPLLRARSQYRIALCYYRLGEYEEALGALNRIQLEDLDDPDTAETVVRARERIKRMLRR